MKVDAVAASTIASTAKVNSAPAVQALGVATVMGIDGPEPVDLVQDERAPEVRAEDTLPPAAEEAVAAAVTDSETVSGSAVNTAGEDINEAVDAVTAVHAGDFSVGVSAQVSSELEDAAAPVVVASTEAATAVAEIVAAVVAETALVAAAVSEPEIKLVAAAEVEVAGEAPTETEATQAEA